MSVGWGWQYLVSSAVLMVIGGAGYQIFLEADFFKTPYDDWEVAGVGFDSTQWVWFLLGTCCLPIALCLHLIFVVQFFKSLSVNYLFKLVAFYLLFAISLFCTVQSTHMCGDILSCGIFCIGPIPADDEVSGQDTGADVAVGLIYFFVSLSISMMYLSLIVTLHVQLAWSSKSNHDLIENKSINAALISPDSVSSMQRHKTSWWTKNRTVLLAFVVFFPLLIFSIMALPNNWQVCFKIFIPFIKVSICLDELCF